MTRPPAVGIATTPSDCAGEPLSDTTPDCPICPAADQMPGGRPSDPNDGVALRAPAGGHRAARHHVELQAPADGGSSRPEHRGVRGARWHAPRKPTTTTGRPADYFSSLLSWGALP